MNTTTCDLAIVGAGAAGLFASIWAGLTDPSISIIAVDGARKIGAKILVAGGGRCNVTHAAVSETAYYGSSRNSIRNVLRQFPVEKTVEFFASRGVTLKAEPTGKLFPTTDDAHTILDALLAAVKTSRVRLLNPWRVTGVEHSGSDFLIARDTAFDHVPGDPAFIRARRLILATGGKALPRTGSDGLGYSFAKALGHTLTPQIVPALVPLTLQQNGQQSHPLVTLSGLALPCTLEVRGGTNKRLAAFTNDTLLTHFGLSGPGPLDISRSLQAAQATDAGAALYINFLPGYLTDDLDQMLATGAGTSVGNFVSDLSRRKPPREPLELAEGVTGLCDLPERLIRVLCAMANIEPSMPCHALTRDSRKALSRTLTDLKLPISGTRGFTFAEVTAGGIPLSEIQLATMESRVRPGLHLCGEILDVDGRIGGYNFQWAWASGFVAGKSAAMALGQQSAT
ncbi:MAG: aminoacetone oxidase family FAD-binding enzyme [Planctomycetes bacterium]|nr:aminoacetone oxidase family FAD-binding enzyme [Planctomycetota bacterium]